MIAQSTRKVAYAAAVAAGSLLAAGAAQAVMMTQSTFFALSASSDTLGNNTSDQQTISLPSFNVALGNLIGVKVTLNSTHNLATNLEASGLASVSATALSDSTAEISGIGFSYGPLLNSLMGSTSCSDAPGYEQIPGGDLEPLPAFCTGFEFQEQPFTDMTDLLLSNSADLFKSTNAATVDFDLLLSNNVSIDSCDSDEAGSEDCAANAGSAWHTDIVDGTLSIIYEFEPRNGGIPEPASLALIGLGLLGVGCSRRRTAS